MESMRHRIARAAVPLLLLFTAGSAVAFETLWEDLIGWRNGRARYRINPSFIDAASGSSADQIAVLRAAAGAWRHQSAANFEFIYDGTTTRSGTNTNDGVNVVSWVDEDGAGALAATVLGGSGNRVAAFDIVFFDRTDGFNLRWSGPGDPANGTLDIAGVAIHEFGHALGLDHTNVSGATMEPAVSGTGVQLRTLAPDDLDGVEFIYGNGRPGADRSPLLELVEPAFGPANGGNEVLLRGHNFTWTADTTLRIGGALLSREAWRIETMELVRIFDMPSHAAGEVDLVINNQLGTEVAADAYRYGTPVPEILLVEPDLVPLSGAIEVTVHGRFLSVDAVVTIGGRPLLDPVLIDSQTIVGTLPAGDVPGTVDVVLTQGLDEVTLGDAVAYTRKGLRIPESTVPRGADEAPVDLLVSTDEPLGGVSFGLVFDADVAALVDIVTEGTVAEGAAFAQGRIDEATGEATFGIVMDFFELEPSIPVGDDQVVCRLVLRADAALEVGQEVTLELADGVGAPPIELFVTPAGTSARIRPYTLSGPVTVSEGLVFVRGDANGDLEVGIDDAVYHLDALFRGGPISECPDAADANDDSRLDVSDAVRILVFLFLGGEPPPPPYPAPDLDPTDDALECE